MFWRKFPCESRYVGGQAILNFYADLRLFSLNKSMILILITQSVNLVRKKILPCQILGKIKIQISLHFQPFWLIAKIRG